LLSSLKKVFVFQKLIQNEKFCLKTTPLQVAPVEYRLRYFRDTVLGAHSAVRKAGALELRKDRFIPLPSPQPLWAGDGTLTTTWNPPTARKGYSML
jgi:hypothetical protein